jgi:hypothetical protein
MKTSITTRLIAAAVSVGATVAIFTAVISIAEQTQADGTVRLAHTAIGAPTTPAKTFVAQADTGMRR